MSFSYRATEPSHSMSLSLLLPLSESLMELHAWIAHLIHTFAFLCDKSVNIPFWNKTKSAHSSSNQKVILAYSLENNFVLRRTTLNSLFFCNNFYDFFFGIDVINVVENWNKKTVLEIHQSFDGLLFVSASPKKNHNDVEMIWKKASHMYRQRERERKSWHLIEYVFFRRFLI